MRRKLSLLLPLAMVALLAVVLAGSLGFATWAEREPTTALKGLPAERAAYYDALLRASQREEAYLIPPREDIATEQVIPTLRPGASRAEIEEAVAQYYEAFHYQNNKVSRPNPMAYLGRMKAREAAALQGGTTPPLSGQPEVMTVLMTFEGTETYQGGAGGDPVSLNGTCLTDTSIYSDTFTFTIDGPDFNEIEQPTDNWTPWIPTSTYTGGFTPQYFTLLMYSTQGYTGTMRADLPNPWDGGNGFNFTGSTFKNFFLENSRGLYDPQGATVSTSIPVAASYFGAGRCNGAVQDDGYHGRPRYTVAISAAQQINLENPGFDWTVWDQEDTFDYDNDANYQEPDGYVDHFFLIEAGEAQGGKYGEFLIWPHSSDVMPGQPIGPAGNQLGGYQVSNAGPLGGVWVLNYTVSDEVGGLGVLVHEYGHDIGLPDNYATSGAGDANVGMWDQMATGVFGGGLSGMHPVHMTIWDKEFLGWNNPVQIDVDATGNSPQSGTSYQIGQQSKPPAGSTDGLRINLPDKTSSASVTPFGTMMWYSDVGDDRNESIQRTFSAPAAQDVVIAAQVAYAIEAEYDYFFFEYSNAATAGAWVGLDVFSGTTEISTDANPNGGNTGNGIDGSSGGWIPATATIPAAQNDGSPINFRFRFYTDGGVQEEGIFLDNITVTSGGPIVTDDAEGGDTWTHASEGINTNAPWFIFDGTITTDHYYLVEWRNSGEGTGFGSTATTQEAFNLAGFDIGLNRMYWVQSSDASGNIAQVDRFPLHTPVMLVYYVNGAYEDNSVSSYIFDDPTWGAKGRVLLADANPYPYVVANGGGQISNRRSAFDGGFTLADRPAFDLSRNGVTTTIPADRAVTTFRDRMAYMPGVRGAPGASAFVDSDSGAVIPAKAQLPYFIAWDYYGDAGNPGVNGYGINVEVTDQAADGTWGQVDFYMDDDTVFVDTHASDLEVTKGETVTYTIELKDAAGSRYSDSLPYTFTASLVNALPAGATYVAGSLSVTSDTFAFYDPGSASFDGTAINWNGQVGGNPTTVPDSIIQYAVTYGALGCYTTTSALTVVQETLVDTFRNGGAPFLWPEQTQYSDSVDVCVVDATAVTVGELGSRSTGTWLPLALAGGLALLAGATLVLKRRKA